MESRNASLFEDVFPCRFKDEASSSKRNLEIIDSQGHESEEEVKVEPRRSKRTRIEKYFGLDFLTYMFESKPQTFKKAVNSLNGPL